MNQYELINLHTRLRYAKSNDQQRLVIDSFPETKGKSIEQALFFIKNGGTFEGQPPPIFMPKPPPKPVIPDPPPIRTVRRRIEW